MAVEDEYIKLAKELLNRIAKTVLYIQTGDCVSSVTVPLFKQISQIASDTILLLEKNYFYNACLIAASMMESILQSPTLMYVMPPREMHVNPETGMKCR